MTASILTDLDTDELFDWLATDGNRLLAQKAEAFISMYIYHSELDPTTDYPTERAMAASRAASALRSHLAVHRLVSSLVDAS